TLRAHASFRAAAQSLPSPGRVFEPSAGGIRAPRAVIESPPRGSKRCVTGGHSARLRSEGTGGDRLDARPRGHESWRSAGVLGRDGAYDLGHTAVIHWARR